ncbi:hypothetical protein CBM2633_U10011 [Cupriavidus taiwanensis]|nr:hypothetical protein CBM2633_U10011 [Cupriavidus taiwanensis]
MAGEGGFPDIARKIDNGDAHLGLLSLSETFGKGAAV